MFLKEIIIEVYGKLLVYYLFSIFVFKLVCCICILFILFLELFFNFYFFKDNKCRFVVISRIKYFLYMICMKKLFIKEFFFKCKNLYKIDCIYINVYYDIVMCIICSKYK